MNEVTSDYKSSTNNQSVIAFFDKSFKEPLEFAANDFDAVVGFFLKRDFEKISALTLAQVLLAEAKNENLKIFELLDTLQGFNKTQLNAIILKVLNETRHRSSQLGFRTATTITQYEERNITDTMTESSEYSNLKFNAVYDVSNIRVGVENQGNILLTRND